MGRMGKRAGVVVGVAVVLSTVLGVAGASTAAACTQADYSVGVFASRLPQVKPGEKGSAVLALQLGLRQRGYGLVGTGNYQRNTEAAVRDFQRKSGINPSGIVGPKTWNALLADTYTASDIGVRHRPQVLPGSRDKRAVDQLRTYLLVISPYQGASGVEDWYGPRLQGMVRDFQRRAGIKASGIVGPRTWAALGRAVAVTGAFSC
ncbi:Peptidoglycan-binding (PGRP) domain of peptidoglycan hydrolases-containing protein [Actinokineospora globicatena]|nr:Peptidoglycan-binding (PGRP) domain of peptidoglycan hydrolases-containing protein [Actinokineospora globicatena]GLW77812.1 hypothetical protein Aglo01_22940 [Actinokineospora globicatena]GLW85520.1 hypothetical protein Aglo02_31600 [Actinokineospora globicatena]